MTLVKEIFPKGLKISGVRSNEEFGLPDGSYSISDIQNCFEHIVKKHETMTNQPPIQVHVNRIKNGVTFKIKSGY